MTANLQPTLIGELVELEPLHPTDYDELYKVASDPLIWEQHPNSDRYQPAVFQQFFKDALASEGAFLVRDAKTRAAIGSTRYHGYDPGRREVEIGWTFLARSHWGGRHNGEMKALMLQHAFEFVDRVIFVIGTHNTRSRRAVEKIGAVYAGPRHDAPGLDKVVYEIRKEAFART